KPLGDGHRINGRPSNGAGDGRNGLERCNGDTDWRQIYRRLSLLFAAEEPMAPRSGDGWHLSPVTTGDCARLEVRQAEREVDDGRILVLRHHGEPAALVTVED